MHMYSNERLTAFRTANVGLNHIFTSNCSNVVSPPVSKSPKADSVDNASTSSSNKLPSSGKSTIKTSASYQYVALSTQISHLIYSLRLLTKRAKMALGVPAQLQVYDDQYQRAIQTEGDRRNFQRTITRSGSGYLELLFVVSSQMAGYSLTTEKVRIISGNQSKCRLSIVKSHPRDRFRTMRNSSD